MYPPKRVEPVAGQESVWDYPRPPKLEPVTEQIRVVFNGLMLADSTSAYRVLETSHPPTYYIPPDDIVDGVLVPNVRRSLCEWKGQARYFDVVVGNAKSKQSAWSYAEPVSTFVNITDHVAFYPHCMHACWVGDEQVEPQPGDFYGGWITSKIAGPFKGAPGTRLW